MINKNHPRRILLDTNVWHYVVQYSKEKRFLEAIRNGPSIVQAAPAVLYETLRDPNAQRRSKRIKLLTDRHVQRLMPEAFSLAEDIKSSIQLHHPEWLKNDPDLTNYNRLRQFWGRKTGKNSKWEKIRRDPNYEAEFLRSIEGNRSERARTMTLAHRKDFQEQGLNHNNLPLDKLFLEGDAGLKSLGIDHPVDLWRIETHLIYTSSLWFDGPGNPMREWLSPFLRLEGRVISEIAWAKYWLTEVNVTEVPREWLQWAHTFSQRFRKVTRDFRRILGKLGGTTRLYIHLEVLNHGVIGGN